MPASHPAARAGQLARSAPSSLSDLGAGATVAAGDPRRLGFEFHGSGAEYFRVWMVNVTLSIVTLGIYSAWAKVRNKQYFYGNTRLEGLAFEYTANPVNILKGRAVVAVAFLVYGLIAALSPRLESAATLIVVALIPWVVVRALAFNARYSAHRNLRFGFDGGYAQALAVYVIAPIVSVLTLGLAYPAAVYSKKKFFVNHSRYGATPFTFEGTMGPMYVIYLKAAAILAGSATISIVAWASTIGSITTNANGEVFLEVPKPLPPEIAIWLLVVVLVLAIGFLAVSTYLQTAVSNYVWQHTRLRRNRFDLRLELSRMLWIQLSNLAMIIATFGLMIPFAKVRIARYRLERMTVLGVENLDDFAAGERDRMSALGEELGDVLDLDLSI